MSIPIDSLPRPTAHIVHDPFFKGLIYGEPGTGKTSFAASAAAHPAFKKMLFISVEGGMLSVPSNPDILHVEIRNDGSGAVMDKLEGYFWALASQDDAKPEWARDVRSVVIDSGTEVLTLALEQVAAEGMATDNKRPKDTLYLADYGKSTAILKRLFRYFRDLPLHVIVTALAKPVYEGKGESATLVRIEPSFTNKLGSAIQGYVDHVWFTMNPVDENGEVTYCLCTVPDALHVAKTRGPAFREALPAVVANPSLAAVYNLLAKTTGPNAGKEKK